MSNVLPRLTARDLNLSNATSYMSARVPAFCPFTALKKAEGIKGRFNNDGEPRKMKYQDRRRESKRKEISEGGWRKQRKGGKEKEENWCVGKV